MKTTIANLFIPRKTGLPSKGISILAGDIGGTKTNLALFHATDTEMKKITEARFHSDDFKNCVAIINKFMASEKLSPPEVISLGVAGPVLDGKVELTNLDWELDVKDIAQQTTVSNVHLLNDLESIGYGLSCLTETDYTVIHPGNANGKGNMAIIAPGTGLGEAGLYWSGRSHYPFATEGGHCDFSPRTSLDVELLQYMQAKYGVVSWEKVVAGPAIHDIYNFLHDVKRQEEPAWLKAEISAAEDAAAVISHAALENKAAICTATMDHFVRYLAREASNLVLKQKAIGGLFLGGGIPPKIAPLLTTGNFYRHYMDCDRMQHLLENVPIRIINNEKTGLLGAAYYGAYCGENPF